LCNNKAKSEICGQVRTLFNWIQENLELLRWI
jgi:hypothetical protein